MLPNDLKHIVLISARAILSGAAPVPLSGGVYLFFFRGGTNLLRATSYFDTSSGPLLSTRRHQHLYTGATRDLAARLGQHMRTDVTSSSLRRTLLAIEHTRNAISTSGTKACEIKGEKSLSEWLRLNAMIGIEPTNLPFEREQQLLSRYASPFNIVFRRAHSYARQLSKWRQATFPASSPQCARRLRHR